ncbi:hypothetical protein CC80DRAFT_573111 [Byssothecium circinans]|uniref:Copper transporter n=1 Tax=Byssothecium circinans TaxID=147558 RepID=A0A6A5TI40_9PLEO|nr:hypothetical protein CC80DRAFT_573111 [Byssothecium circinans]
MTTLSPCSHSSDNSFGRRVDRHCRSFDFTFLFEDVVFIVISSALLVLFLHARLKYLKGSTIKVLSRRLLVFKVV